MANSLLLFGGIFVLFHAFEPNGVLRHLAVQGQVHDNLYKPRILILELLLHLRQRETRRRFSRIARLLGHHFVKF